MGSSSSPGVQRPDPPEFAPGEELNAYRRRRAGLPIPEHHERHFARFTPNMTRMFEHMADQHDDLERQELAKDETLTGPNVAHDPRLAPVADANGCVDRGRVRALLSRAPRTFTLSEVVAMYVVFFEDQGLVAGLELTHTREWADALTEVVGGTITREKIRHGKVVDRSVRRFRGRQDVRCFRSAAGTPAAVIQPRATARESHRTRPGHRRASSSSSTSAQDPGSSDESDPPSSRRQCAAPWCDHLVFGPPQQRYCRTERCDQARDAERQRKHRHGDLSAVELERLELARRAGRLGEAHGRV